ncbi:MAG: hypothetical protein AAB071_02625, partial [Bacteroidota bacterium]
MKRFFTVYLFFFFFSTLSLLATDKRAVASGEWGDPNIWSPTGVPTSSDSVIIHQTAGFDYVSVTISSANAVCAALLIDPDYIGDSLTITNGRTLTVNRGIETNGYLVFFGGGGTLNLAGNWILNGTFVPGISTVRFFGTNNQAISGSTTTFDNFVVNKSSGTLTLTSTDCPVQSNWTDSSGTIDLGAFKMDRTIASGGTFTIAGSAIVKIGGSNSFPSNYTTSYNLSSSSTVEYYGVSQTVPNKTYGHLLFSGSGTKNASESITINGDLTISSGTTFGGGSSKKHKIGGSWTNNGSFTTGINDTVEFNGTGTQYISGSSVTQFRNLRINKSSGSVMLSNNLTTSSSGGEITVVSGTLDIVSFTCDRASSGGTFTVSSSAIFRLSGTSNFPANYSAVSLASSSTFEYYGTSQNISTQTYGNLTIAGSSTKTVSGNITVVGALTIGSGTAFIENSNSLSTTLGGNLVNNGVYYGIGTTIFNNSTTISGTGTTKLGSVTISGILNDGGKTIFVRGAWTNSGTFTTTGTVQLDSTAAQSIGASNFYNLTVNKPSGTATLGGTATVSNDFNLSSGTFSTGSNQSFNSKNVTITTGTFQANGSSVTVTGNWSRSGTFTSGTSTVTFSGSTAQSVGGSQFYNLTMSGSGLKTGASSGMKVSGLFTLSGSGGFNDGGFSDTLNGNLDNSSSYYGIGATVFGGTTSLSGTNGIFKFKNVIINSSSSLNSNGKTIYVRGDWTSTGTFTSSDTVVCDSTLSQTFNAGKFYNLTINKSSSSVTLAGTDSVTNNFLLTSGTLNTNGQNFVVLQNATISASGTLSAGASNIYIGGDWSRSGTFTSGTSTVTFFKSGNQNIQSTTFNSVTLSGSGNKIATGNCTTAGTLTIGANTAFVENTNAISTTVSGNIVNNGAFVGIGTTTFGGSTTLSGSGLFKFGNLTISNTLVDGGKTISVRGNWTKSGTFTSTGTTQFDSSLAQTVNASNFYNFTLGKSSGTVTLNGAITVDNDFTMNGGDLTTGSLSYAITSARDFSINSGNLTSNGSTITVGRHWRKSGTFTSSTSTVVFNGASAESVNASNFYNVSFSGAGIKYLVGNSYTVSGNISIGSTSPVSAVGNGTMTITGNWSNSGTFTPNASTLAFNKAGTATFTGTTDVYNFIVNSGTILSLSNSDTIRFQSGGALTETGYISGRVKYAQTLSSAGTNYSFGNIGAILNYTGTAPGATTILRTTGSTPSGLDQALTRYFVITPTTKTGLNLSLKLKYKGSVELNGQTEANIKLWRKEDGFTSWTRQTGSIVDTTNDTLSLTGVTSLSTWGFSSTDARLFSVTTGNWNDSSSWSPAGIPSSGDSVYIGSGKTCTIPNDYSAVVNSISNAGTLVASNNNALTIYGNWNNIGTFTSGAGLVIFAGTNQSLTSTNFYSVQFSNGGTKTVTGSLNIDGNITIDANVTLNMSNYSHTVAGDWTNSGTFSTTGQITFDGVTQSMNGGTFYNISFSGSGTKTVFGSLNVNNDFSISSNVTVNAGSFSINVTGNWSKATSGVFQNSGGTVTFNGASQNISASSFGNVVFAGTGIKTATGALVVNGNLTINANSTFKAGAFVDSVSGNWSNNGAFDSASSLIVFNGSSAQSISASGFNHIEFVGSGVKTATGILKVAGDIIINSGSSFTGGNLTHLLGGNWTNNGLYVAGTGTLHFTKNGAAVFYGNTAVNNLIISSVTTLNVDTTNIITLAGTLTESGYLSGKILKSETITQTGVQYNFGGIGATVSLAGSVPDILTIISYRKLIPVGFASNQAVQRYYSITKSSTSTATIGLKYNETKELNGQTESSLKMWRSTNSGTSWSREASSSVVAGSDSLSLTASIGTSSLFGISSTSTKTLVVASGDWNEVTSWSPSGIPISSDSVYIGAGKTAVINGSDSVNCAGINIEGTLSFANDGKLNVFGAWSNASGSISSGSGTVYYSGSPTYYSGTSALNNVVVSANKTLRMLATSVIKIAGTFTVLGTYDAISQTPNKLEYNSADAQNITAVIYNGLAVSGGNTKTASGAITVNDTLNINSSTIFSDNANSITVKSIVKVSGTYTGTGTLLVDGSSSLEGSGSISFGNLTLLSARSFATGTTSFSISGNLSNSGSFTNTGTITLSGTGKTISGTSTSQFNKLKVTGIITASSDISLQDSLTVSNQFYSTATTNFIGTNVLIGNAIFTNATINPSRTLTLATNATMEIRGNLTISGTLNTSSTTNNTVWYSSLSSGIASATYNNLRLTGGNTKASNNGNVTINGTFSVDSSTIFDGNSFSVVFNGIPSSVSSANNGTFKFNDVTINNGKSLSAGATYIYVKGNWTNNGAFSASGSGVVDFNRNDGSSQTLTRTIFQNVVFSGTGSKILGGNLITNGNVTLGSGTTFNPGATSDTIKGDFTNNGAGFEPTTTSTFVFNGSAQQTITGSFYFYNMTVNNANSVYLNTSGDIGGQLTITSGKLYTNNNIVTLSSTGKLVESSSNKVSGKIRTTRNVVNSGTQDDNNSFGGLGIIILSSGSQLGNTTVTRTTDASIKGNGVDSVYSSIKRYFDVQPTGNSSLNTTVRFKYDASEISLPNVENDLHLWSASTLGAAWVDLGGTVTTATKTIEKTGVTSFGIISASSLPLQPRSATVRMWRDKDGIDSTTDDWVQTNWSLKIKRTSTSGATVDSNNSATKVSVDSLSTNSYFAIVGDSNGWYHKAIRQDGALIKTTANNRQFSFSDLFSDTIDFSSFHPSKITVRVLKDSDASFLTSGDRANIAWDINLNKFNTQTGLYDLRKRLTTSKQLIDTLLEDAQYSAGIDDSAGWLPLGYVLTVNGVRDSFPSSQTIQPSFTAINGQTITLDFVYYSANVIIVRQYKDIDGLINTVGDRTAKAWSLKLYKGEVHPDSLKSQGNTDRLTTTNLPDGIYIAVEAESLGWKPIGFIRNDTTYTVADTVRKAYVTIGGGDSIFVDFLSVHLNTIIIKNLLDTDNDFSNDSAMVGYPWGLKVRKDTPTGTVIGSTSADSQLIVTNLANGTYYAQEIKQSGWKRLGYYKDGQKITSKDTSLQIIFLSGGQTTTIEFVNSNADSFAFRTVKQFSSSLVAKTEKLTDKKGKRKEGVQPSFANVRDTTFLRIFPKKPKTVMVCGIKQVLKDSAKKYGWVEYKKGTSLIKNLPQSNTPRAFDFIQGKFFVKALKNPK